jgi:hypothetical protein
MTDQTMSALGAPQFSIGNAISVSFGVFGRHLVAFSVIPAVMLVPLIIIGVMIALAFGLSSIGNATPANMHTGIFIAAIPIILVYYASILVGMAAIAYGTIQDLRHQKAGIGACLARGFGSVVPLVLAALAVGILFIVGSILFIVPGLMIWTAFSIVAPAIVVEKLGVGDGMRRSRELTKGRRWSVFGVLILSALCLGALNYLISHIIGPMLGAAVNGLLSLVVTVMIQGFQAVLVAVVYYQLRVEKEGISIDDIARVFD